MLRRAIVTVLLVCLAACSSTQGTKTAPRPSTLSPDAIPVLVSTRTIPAGMTGAEALRRGLIKTDARTRAEFPEDAIVTTSLLEGRVARTTIPPGVVITGKMFTDAPSR